MEDIVNNWPFVPGQQAEIFQICGFAVIGAITLNIISAVRKQLPFRQIISSLFVLIPFKNRIETIVEGILIAILILGFIVLVLDISINGFQLL